MKSKSMPLTAAIIARVTPVEAMEVRTRAHDLDMTVSQYVRFAVLRYDELVPDPRVEQSEFDRLGAKRKPLNGLHD